MMYPLDPRLFEIDYASLIYKGSNGMLPYVLALTTPQELDGVRPFWRTLPYRPTGIIAYDTQLGTDALPDTAYTIKVEGYRLPIATMDTLATAEVLATGSVTLTAGTTGTVATVKVNGLDVLGSAVAFNASLTQTAADVVTQINLNQNKYVASSLNEVITLTDLRHRWSQAPGPGHFAMSKYMPLWALLPNCQKPLHTVAQSSGPFDRDQYPPRNTSCLPPRTSHHACRPSR